MLALVRRSIAVLTAASFVASGFALAPQAAIALRVLDDLRDPVAAARIQLAEVEPAAYPKAAEEALADGDPLLADGIRDLASERGVAFPAELAARVDDAVAERGGVLTEVWNGAVFGEVDGAAGLAATVATDLMVIGDIRDLIRQGAAYPDHDPVIVALAAVGVGLTAATLATGGAATPVKVGASVLKAARRGGKLGMRLADDLARLTRNAIDWAALREVAAAAGRLDGTAARRAAGMIVNPRVADELSGAASALGAVARRQGARAAMDTLALADNTAEVRRLGRVAEGLGDGYRPALKLAPRLGKGVAKVSKTVFRLAGWIAAAIAWAAGVLWLAIKALKGTVRLAVAATRRRRMRIAGWRPVFRDLRHAFG